MIPDLETSDVQLKGASCQDPLWPLPSASGPREDRVATIAHFAVASTTPNLFDAVARQAPVTDLALNENTERFLVHRGLAGKEQAANMRQIHRGLSARRRQPVRPGCRQADSSTKFGYPGEGSNAAGVWHERPPATSRSCSYGRTCASGGQAEGQRTWPRRCPLLRVD